MHESHILEWPRSGELPLNSAWQNSYYTSKRFVDVLLASALLVLLAPALLLIGMLIKLDSPGPVMFSQDRIGSRRKSRQGRTRWEIRTFRFYKFRSMAQGADPTPHQEYIRAFVEHGQEGSGLFKLTNDARVTRLGRTLRKLSLDELPQLFNVLKGDMTLVGPRPVPIYEFALYQEPHYGRLMAPQGITGLWQVTGRCQVPFEEMIRLDLEYVRSASLWLDFKILLQTIPNVLSGRGAE